MTNKKYSREALRIVQALRRARLEDQQRREDLLEAFAPLAIFKAICR